MSALTEGNCVRTTKVTTTISRKVSENHGNYTTFRRVPDHDIEADVELWIDYDSILAQLSTRAVRSKGKKAQVMNGAIVLRATNLKKTKVY